MNIFRGAIGLCFIISIAYAFSADRKNIDWRLVASGIFIQLVIGLLIAKVAIIGSFFGFISDKFVSLFKLCSWEVQNSLFGDLAKNSDQASGARHSLGFLFAFQALPIIIFLFVGHSRAILSRDSSKSCLVLLPGSCQKRCDSQALRVFLWRAIFF